MLKRMERAKALRKLYDNQLTKIPESIPDPERKAKAAGMMDELVGKSWRVEIKLPGLEFIAEDSRTAPADPSDITDIVEAENCDFVSNIRNLLNASGESPDLMPKTDSNEWTEEERTKKELLSIKQRISKLLGE
jgi:hypothetical protein